MALLDSAYEVLRLAGGGLQIVDPGDKAFGSVILTMGVIPTAFFVYRIVKSGSLFPAWGILLFGLPLLYAGLLPFRGGTLTLDRSSNKATFHQPVFLWHSDNTVPLDSLSHAEIRSMRSSDYIAVVLANGDALTFSGSSQQNGKGRAVVAINQYIGASVR